MYEYIQAHCELCGWKGNITECVDFDSSQAELDAEYCPSCHSPYVIYDKFTMSFGEEDEMD